VTAAAGGRDRPIDRDRQAAYDAERFAFEGSWLMGRISSAQAIALAQPIVATPAWRRLVPEPIAFSTTVGANSWCDGALRIAFAPRVERATVAHELAHAAAFHRAAGSAGHGAGWRGWFVTVVQVVHGDEAAHELAAAFATYGLQVTPTGIEWSGRPLVGLGD
jgi:hypothetical protein